MTLKCLVFLKGRSLTSTVYYCDVPGHSSVVKIQVDRILWVFFFN